MRLGILTFAAVVAGLACQPAWSETKQKQAKPTQVAQRQIICTASLHGCKEVGPGCHVENMDSKFHDASGHQREVCPGDQR